MGVNNQDYRFKTQYYRPANNKPVKRRSPANKYFLSLLMALLVTVAAGAVVSALHNPKKPSKTDNSISNYVYEIAKKPDPSLSAASQLNLDGMSATINGIIQNNSAIDTSVSIIDLNTNKAEHYGDTNTFTAGSVEKVITAEYFLHEVEAGSQSLSEQVNGNTAEYELQQMIAVSDDNAWEALNNVLGYNNLQNYASSTLGLTSFDANTNSLNSDDMSTAMQDLWQGKVLNKANTELLLGYLEEANYRDFIVPAIPNGDTIYHKIGLFEDDVNDTSIISHGNQAFVLTIFTDGNGVYNWPGRATVMQDIAKAALKAYFNQT